MPRTSVLCLLFWSALLDSPSSFEFSAHKGQIPTKRPACRECLQVRIGVPRVVRGPSAYIPDNRFTEIRLPDGRFRGFTADGDTYAIDGNSPFDMGGPLRKVLRRGAQGTYDSCGQWLQHVEQVGGTALGFVHNETACHWQAGQTHKSMSLAASTDYGLTWKNEGLILTGRDSPTPNKSTGEGDCTFLNGQDSYYYAYCGRPGDDAVIVARASTSDPGPGKWMNYLQGKWEQPGLGGDATPLVDGPATSAARWSTTGETLLLGWIKGGMGLFLSDDHITFSQLGEPLLALVRKTGTAPLPRSCLLIPSCSMREPVATNSRIPGC
jgi:hypothetical protein